MLSSIALFYQAPATLAQKVEGVMIEDWLKDVTPVCYGGTFRVALPSEPNTFNWFVAGSSWSIMVLEPIYSRLVRIVNGTLTFEVAESIEWAQDHMSLTIKIRDGIMFSDGKPLTAEDVAFTINVLAQKTWTYYHGYFASVDRAEAVDERTVKIYFKNPDAGFVYNALAVMNIMPKHIWEPLLNELGDGLAKYSPKIPDDLVGSGPFKIVEYKPAQYVKYVANENYWLGRPFIDELVIVFITEANVAILAVQKGDVDVYQGWVTPEVVPQLLSTPGVALHTYTSQTFYHWGLNNLKWPFNISKFRLAMAFAVDREAIVRELLLGYGIPGSPGVVPPVGVQLQWYNPAVENAYYFDLNMTAKLLDELGFVDVDNDGWREAPDGSDFSFEIWPPAYDIIRVRAAEMISKWLSQIPGGGIKAVVRVADWKTVWPNIRDAKLDSWLLGSGPGPDISWLFRRFHSRPEGTGNWVRYANPEVDRLTEELKVTFDFEKRKELAYRIQEILAEDVPVITLYYRKFPIPFRVDRFDGWFQPADGSVYNIITLHRVQLKPSVCPKPVVATETAVVEKTVTQEVLRTVVKEGRTIVQTQVETKVVTQVVTQPATVTEQQPVETGIPATMVAAVVIVTIIIGFAIGYLLRRR